MQFRNVAETQVKGSLLLEALARQEKLEVTNADIAEKIKQIAAQNNKDVETVENFYNENVQAKDNLSAQIREDKAVELVMSKATISEVERSELENKES